DAAQPPAAEQVHVEVVDLLAAMLVAVDDQPVPLLQALLLRYLRRRREHAAQRGLVLGPDVVGGGDQRAGHDQHVGGRPGADVTERRDEIVLVDDVRRDLAADDLAEDRLLWHVTSLRSRTTVLRCRPERAGGRASRG